MKTRVCIIIMIINLICLYSNDSFSYRENGSGLILLTENEDISMIYENLEYDFKNQNYMITYTFQNNSQIDQDITIAFPVSSSGYSGYEREIYSTLEEWMLASYHFNTEIEGQVYNRELIKLDSESITADYDYAFVLDVKIPNNMNLTIIDRYGSKGTSRFYYDYFYPENNDLQTQIWFTNINQRYILKTANNWSEDIHDFRSSYKVGYFNNFIAIGNDIYFFNNTQLRAIQFESNYSEMQLTYDINADGSEIEYIMNFNHFSPSDNLDTKLSDIRTESLNALTFSGTILEYLESSEYNEKHIIYMFDMIYKIFPEEQFINILYEAIIKLDKYYSDEELRSLYFSDHDDYISTEIVTLSRFYLNYLFAIEGYNFNSKKWKSIFSYYDWYNPEVKNVIFNKIDEQNIEVIKGIRSKYNSISEEAMLNNNFKMPKFELEYQGK